MAVLIRRALVLGGLAALALPAPGGGTVAWAQAAAPAGPPVTVVEVKSGKVPITYEYAARIAASRVVEVRAQVGGILLRRNFTEGAAVNAGDLLFEIDPKPYEAQLAVAQAQLQQAQAQLSQATRDADRNIRLAVRGAVSEKARDDALSAKELATAQVAAAQAQLKLAQLNLGYTRVTAPISGLTGQEQVPEGSLIGTTADTSLLTRITQVDPAYVNYSVSESELTEARSLLDSQGLWQRAAELVSVHVVFGDGQQYPEVGKFDFAPAGLDPNTGTLRVRAIIANPDHRLLPGQFVRAVITGISLPDAIVVPHEAVMQGPQGQFVYTVNSQGKAEIRPVVLGRELKAGWVVQSGLKNGDRLITEGIIKVQPGMPVTASPAAPGQPGTDQTSTGQTSTGQKGAGQAGAGQ